MSEENNLLLLIFISSLCLTFLLTLPRYGIIRFKFQLHAEYFTVHNSIASVTFVSRWKHFSDRTCTFAGCICSNAVDAPYSLHFWVCRWLQYSCRSFWFSISSFHCKGNSVSFFSRLTEMGSSIWCSGGIIKWLIVERLIFANGGVWCACWQKEILFCWVDFFSTEVKKDKKATEGENANVLYIFVL